MKTTFLIACIAALVMFNSSAVAQVNATVKATVECTISGTKANGEKSTKPFVERIQIEGSTEIVTGKDGKPEEWRSLNAPKLISDGKKQKWPELVTATPEYAVLANAVTIGTGFERRLLVFTYMLDLKAMQLTRVVNSLPASVEERSAAACQAK